MEDRGDEVKPRREIVPTVSLFQGLDILIGLFIVTELVAMAVDASGFPLGYIFLICASLVGVF